MSGDWWGGCWWESGCCCSRYHDCACRGSSRSRSRHNEEEEEEEEADCGSRGGHDNLGNRDGRGSHGRAGRGRCGRGSHGRGRYGCRGNGIRCILDDRSANCSHGGRVGVHRHYHRAHGGHMIVHGHGSNVVVHGCRSRGNEDGRMASSFGGGASDVHIRQEGMMGSSGDGWSGISQ